MFGLLKQYSFSRSFVMAVACAQIFTSSPDLSSGTAQNMPATLSQAVAPYISQGFYVMQWQKASVGTGYYVDFYVSDPGRVGSYRDDFRAAASRGMGLNVRKFIRNNNY